MKALVRIAIVVFMFGMLVACLTTGTPVATPIVAPAATAVPASSVPPSPVSAATPTGVATAAAVAGTGGTVPGSWDALVPVVGPYMGGVATTKSLGSPKQLSCEFANANASTIIIVNIGAGGTAAAFDTLRTGSAKDGRTVTPISGLGVSAFSVSKGNVPAGLAVLTAGGLLYDVNSNLTVAQDEALVTQLMAL